MKSSFHGDYLLPTRYYFTRALATCTYHCCCCSPNYGVFSKKVNMGSLLLQTSLVRFSLCRVSKHFINMSQRLHYQFLVYYSTCAHSSIQLLQYFLGSGVFSINHTVFPHIQSCAKQYIHLNLYGVKWPQEKQACHSHDATPLLPFQLQVTEDFF